MTNILQNAPAHRAGDGLDKSDFQGSQHLVGALDQSQLIIYPIDFLGDQLMQCFAR